MLSRIYNVQTALRLSYFFSPDCTQGVVCPCANKNQKSDILLKSLGVVFELSGEPEYLVIFRRQTLELRPKVCLRKIPCLQTSPQVKFFKKTPAAFQQFVPYLKWHNCQVSILHTILNHLDLETNYYVVLSKSTSGIM